MQLPNLSEFDPDTKGEGSIDPLGLYGIADALGVRLVPAVRERQGTVRFLTAMAVSLWVCDTYDPERVSSDGASEPWQVFEWYTVEGLVRAFADSPEELRGTPGSAKAQAVLRDRVHLCAERYLKTPTVFGYHGIYRILARDLGIDAGGRLGDFGYELMETWANEQGLPGFAHDGRGAGADLLRSVRDAVTEGLNQNRVARSSSWDGWRLFPDHLAPHHTYAKEAEQLRGALLESLTGHRREVIEFLVSKPGRGAWDADENPSERRFHATLRENASPGLAELLDAIALYERFARHLHDAFQDALVELTRCVGRLSAAELGGLLTVTNAAREVPALFPDVLAHLEPFDDLAVRFESTFTDVSERASSPVWLGQLMAHHQMIQRRKAPKGKAPWVEVLDDGRYLLRTLYRTDEIGAHDDRYVHAYRTRPLWAFARDLEWLT